MRRGDFRLYFHDSAGIGVLARERGFIALSYWVGKVVSATAKSLVDDGTGVKGGTLNMDGEVCWECGMGSGCTMPCYMGKGKRKSRRTPHSPGRIIPTMKGRHTESLGRMSLQARERDLDLWDPAFCLSAGRAALFIKTDARKRDDAARLCGPTGTMVCGTCIRDSI